MNFLKTLLGKKSQPPDASADPAQNKDLIRVHDQFGRELFISRDQWRKSVLPNTIRNAWTKPDELYGVIITALQDEFVADVAEAAEHLHRIDPEPERGACIWAIVLLKSGKIDAAERVLRESLQKHGENGYVLTNLAKVYVARKDDRQAEQILWHALEVDPNQDNGLPWYVAIRREQHGEADEETLRRVAALPGSWRAQVHLARIALQSQQLEEAFAYYHEAFSRIGRSVPADVLMQISGDLGNAGRLRELLQLIEPRFRPDNNLIKAHVDLGQLDAARGILDQLYALKRPDWQPTLSFWDTEIAKVRVARSDRAAEPLEVQLLAFEGPVWLGADSPAAALFPAAPVGGMSVGLLGSTIQTAATPDAGHRQLADAPGRLSRAVPLFLAEQLALRGRAGTWTFVPWLAGEQAFMVSGAPLPDKEIIDLARQHAMRIDWMVVTHIVAAGAPWTVQLRLLRAEDGTCLGTLSASFTMEKPEEGIPALAAQLLSLLARHAGLEAATPPPAYEVPLPHFGDYLLRLEQLLAVRCGRSDRVQAGFLSGEREIIDGNIRLCLAQPRNVGVRVLLAQTLRAMSQARPDILPEFREKLAVLQKEHPLPDPAHGIVQAMLDQALAG
jgi:tetratricopeptide (TPR) repeat protein